jgi:hypothetical protein
LRLIQISPGDNALHLSSARSHPRGRDAPNADAIAENADAIASNADPIALYAFAIALPSARSPVLRLSSAKDALGNDRTRRFRRPPFDV